MFAVYTNKYSHEGSAAEREHARFWDRLDAEECATSIRPVQRWVEVREVEDVPSVTIPRELAERVMVALNESGNRGDGYRAARDLEKALREGVR